MTTTKNIYLKCLPWSSQPRVPPFVYVVRTARSLGDHVPGKPCKRCGFMGCSLWWHLSRWHRRHQTCSCAWREQAEDTGRPSTPTQPSLGQDTAAGWDQMDGEEQGQWKHGAYKLPFPCAGGQHTYPFLSGTRRKDGNSAFSSAALQFPRKLNY